MIESLILLSFAVATISLTVSKSKIFHSTREWIASKSKWLGELVSCFYCFSHWVSLVLVAITGVTTQFGFILTVLAVISMSSVITSVVIGLTGGPVYSHDDEE